MKKEQASRLTDQVRGTALVAAGLICALAGSYFVTQPLDVTPPVTPQVQPTRLPRETQAQVYCIENRLASTIPVDATPQQARAIINDLSYCAYLVQTQGIR